MCQQKAMSEGTLSKTRTEACSGDGTRLAGAPCEKPMGRKPAWKPGLAVEKPDQNREVPPKNRAQLSRL